jgi:hypothetical protein
MSYVNAEEVAVRTDKIFDEDLLAYEAMHFPRIDFSLLPLPSGLPSPARTEHPKEIIAAYRRGLSFVK